MLEVSSVGSRNHSHIGSGEGHYEAQSLGTAHYCVIFNRVKMSDLRGHSEGFSDHLYHITITFSDHLRSQRQHTIHSPESKTHVNVVTQFFFLLGEGGFKEKP